MADENDDAARTEDPTSRKLSRGQEEGQVHSSQEVKNWMMLLGASLGLLFMAPAALTKLSATLLPFVAETDRIPMDFENVRRGLYELSLAAVVILGPFLGFLMVLAFFGSVLQTGLVYSPGKITPKLEKISLNSGIKRLFSMRALVEFIKGIIKVGVVAAVGTALLMPYLEDYQFQFGFEIGQLLDRLDVVVLRLMVGAVAVMTAIAILDYAYTRFEFMKQMRMTKQEVKDEHKQSEGDPQVKARIRRIRTERAQRRMMAAVPRADVVITNPTHFAVALEYKMKEMNAPRLVAKGTDLIALKIRQIAEDNSVPIVENPPLARALFATVELDQEIPPDHYKAVAEVIGYVMRLRGELPQKAS